MAQFRGDHWEFRFNGSASILENFVICYNVYVKEILSNKMVSETAKVQRFIIQTISLILICTTTNVKPFPVLKSFRVFQNLSGIFQRFQSFLEPALSFIFVITAIALCSSLLSVSRIRPDHQQLR